MVNKLKISIVTIVRNGEKYIEPTLKSCIKQSYSNKEYLVIDGKSSDKTLEIVNRYSTKIDCIISEKDQGIYDAMNKGLMLSKGDYIIFMNGGDEFCDEDSIERAFSGLSEKQLLPNIIYGDSYVVEPNKHDRLYKKARHSKYAWYGMFTNHQSIFYNLKKVKESKLTYDTKYKIGADYKFTLECLLKDNKALYVPIPISIFYLDGVSNKMKQIGLLEAEMAREEVLNYSIIKNLFIRQLLYAARVMAERFGFFYRYMRYKNH